MCVNSSSTPFLLLPLPIICCRFVNKNVQPNENPCMNDLMHYTYGSLDGPTMLKYVSAVRSLPVLCCLVCTSAAPASELALMNERMRLPLPSAAFLTPSAPSPSPPDSLPLLPVQMEQTGDMHVAVYDWNNLYMYVSNAGLADANGNAQPAYDRPFLRFDMGALWNTTLADY